MTATLERPRHSPDAPDPAGRGLPTRAVLAAGRLAGAVSRRSGRGRGSTLPGRVGLRLQPDLLGRLAAGRTLLLVSGTNGKSTTSRYLAAALATRGTVLTNSDGSNMRAGLATTLMTRPVSPGEPVVLEIDEHVLTTSAAELQPQVVVLLNLTRDQLDRTGEVHSHVRGWTVALRHVPHAVVVANSDDPLVCAAVLAARPDGDRVCWVAAGQPWRRDCPLCPRCGDAWPGPGEQWACWRCGFARPAASWRLVGNRLHVPTGGALRLRLALPGRANLANAAIAIAACAGLGLGPQVAAEAMAQVSQVDGRYLFVDYAAHRVRLLLAKNPAGWAEVLDQLAGQHDPVVVAVNARGADGADTSWLWDVPFEQLRGRTVVAAGERSADLSLRLLYAGVAHTCEPDPLRAAQHLPGRDLQVVANYTAFTSVRDRLRDDSRPSGPVSRAA